MGQRLMLQLFVVASLLGVFLVPLPALAAYNPLGNVDCGKAPDAAVCQSTGGDPLTGPDGLIIQVTNIVSLVAGIAAVIFLVLAGIKYITSNGAADQIAKAKESIIYALVGLIFIALSRSIIGFIIGRL